MDAEFIRDLFAQFGPVTVRRMFSGAGIFRDGMMFGLIVRDELFLKVGETNLAAFEAAGEAAFSYETRTGTHTLRSYWRCPPELLDDGETFRDWAHKAIEAATAASRAKPKAPRGRSGRP